MTTTPIALGLAVTGIGIVSAAGAGAGAFREALRGGRRAIGPVPRLAGLPVTAGGAVPDAAIGAAGLRPGEDRVLAMGALAAEEALEDAGIGVAGRGSTGISLGTALGAVEQLEGLFGEEAPGRSGGDAAAARARAVPHHDLTDRIALRLGLGGPRSTFSVTCASGLCALEQAAGDLRAGRAVAMLVGGADTLSRFMQTGFCALKALSPSGRLRPLEVGRDGIVLGEGAAFVVVETIEEARRRGAPVRAVIAGNRLRSDGTHLTSPDGSGAGMAAAAAGAMAEAGIAHGELGAVSFTAAGSPIYDRMQSRAVRLALAPVADRVPATTWEGSIGHALASTAVIGLVNAVQTIGDGEVLPIAGRPPASSIDPECSLRYLLEGPEVLRSPAVLALTVGFGGQNGATVVVGAGRGSRR